MGNAANGGMAARNQFPLYSISNELLFRYTSLLGHGIVVVGGKGPRVGTKSSKPPPKIDAAIGWPCGNSLAPC
jgi:hypothetical protein